MSLTVLLVAQAILNLLVPQSAGKGDYSGPLSRSAMPGIKAQELPGLQTHKWTAQTPSVVIFVNEKAKKVIIH